MLDMRKTADNLKSHYEQGHLTEKQFKVLLGLVLHNDQEGAIKGLHKILRRNKNAACSN